MFVQTPLVTMNSILSEFIGSLEFFLYHSFLEESHTFIIWDSSGPKRQQRHAYYVTSFFACEVLLLSGKQ